MALNALGLGFVLTAKDYASGVVSKVKDSLMDLHQEGTKMRQVMEGAWKGFSYGSAVAAVGLGALTGAFALASKAGGFESAMSAVGVATKASAEEMNQLHAAATSTDLILKGASFEDQANALKALGQEGSSAADAMAMLTPAIELSNLIGQSAEETSHLLADAMSGYGLEAKDAALSVDQIAFAMQRFGIEGSEVQGAIIPMIGASKAMETSFADTLLTTGIINSEMGSMGKSAASANIAMKQLADKKSQAALKALGVATMDAKGNFIPLIEVMGEVTDKMAGMTKGKQAEGLKKIFGAQGAKSMGIIMSQLGEGIEDANGKLLKGGLAVDYLRKQMEDASGTAAMMGSKLMDNLPGQMKVLGKAFDSLSTQIGLPLAAAFKPVVVFIIDGLNSIISSINKMPTGLKNTLAKVALALGVLVTVIGVVIAGVSAAVLFSGALEAIGVALAGVAVAILPIIVMVGLVAAAFYGFKIAYDQNIGGFADSINGLVGKVTLGFEALSQLFNDGGFSGSVREELNKADNQGLKAFVIKIFGYAARIEEFVTNLVTGFQAGMATMGPTFEKLSATFDRVGASLGLVEANDPAKSAASWKSWGDTGLNVGVKLANALDWVINAVISVIEFGENMAKAWNEVKHSFDDVVPAVDALSNSFGALSIGVGASDPSKQTSGWAKFAQQLGVVVSLLTAGVGGATSQAIGFLAGFVSVVDGMGNVVKGLLTGNWSQAWKGARQEVFGLLTAVNSMALGILRVIATMIDGIGKVAGRDLGMTKKLEVYRDQLTAATNAVGGIVPTADTTPAKPQGGPSQDYLNQMQTVLNSQLRTGLENQGAPGPGGGDNASSTAAMLAAMKSAPPSMSSATMTVDGEVLGRIVTKYQRSAASSDGIHVPVEG